MRASAEIADIIISGAQLLCWDLVLVHFPLDSTCLEDMNRQTGLPALLRKRYQRKKIYLYICR